jgi:hypothetical protein
MFWGFFIMNPASHRVTDAETAVGSTRTIKHAPCLCCPLLALCCSSALSANDDALVQTARLVSNDVIQAELMLNRYSANLAITYACGFNQRLAYLFDGIPFSQLSTAMAGEFSPELLKFIEQLQSLDPRFLLACDSKGPVAEIYQEPAMTDTELNGLRMMDAKADGARAFENGIFYRIRGYEQGFERFVRSLMRRFEDQTIDYYALH